MKVKSILRFCFLCLGVTCFALSCKNETDSIRPVALECMYTHLTDMENMLDTAKIGTVDGTFPKENADLLQTAVEELRTGISKGKAGMFVLQYEIDNYCIAAEKAVDEFQNSYQMTLGPGTPAELKVFGIDGKGHIEFGESPDFGGKKAFTVEAWLKYDAGFFESGIGSFLTTFDGHQPQEGWMINFMGANMRTSLGMGPKNEATLEHASAYPTNYGEWNHIVMTYDDNATEEQLKMYLNGNIFFTKTNDVVKDGELQHYNPNQRDLRMWAFQEPTDHGRCMTGFIKKFRLWDGAKSAEEVTQLMQTDVTGRESGLVCAWDFTEVPDDINNIPDKTGRHSAKIVGNYKWFKAN